MSICHYNEVEMKPVSLFMYGRGKAGMGSLKTTAVFLALLMEVMYKCAFDSVVE